MEFSKGVKREFKQGYFNIDKAFFEEDDVKIYSNTYNYGSGYVGQRPFIIKKGKIIEFYINGDTSLSFNYDQHI